jgi:hypothetical protein
MVAACAEGTSGGGGPGTPDAGQQGGADARPGGNADAAPAADATPSMVTLSHSTNSTITAENSVSCNLGAPDFFHSENSYYRVYDLTAMGVSGSFNVQSVVVGIESAASLGGTQPATVRLHTQTGATLNLASLSQIGTASTQIANATATTITVPVTGTAPAGSKLVVELLTPDGQTTNNTFFIGSNTAGETGPSYLRAPDCGINEPTVAATAAPGVTMHIVLDVIGTAN